MKRPPADTATMDYAKDTGCENSTEEITPTTDAATSHSEVRTTSSDKETTLDWLKAQSKWEPLYPVEAKPMQELCEQPLIIIGLF